jgi:hypothetical protein
MKEDLLTDEVPLHAKKKKKTEGQLSPSGVLLDSVTKQLDLLSIHKTEADPDDDGDNDVLNMTLVYEGEVDEDASDDERKKRKKKIKKWDKKARLALGILLRSLHPSLLPFVGRETNPRRVYLSLYKRYRPQTHGYTLLLFKQLSKLKMGPNDSVHSYMDRATGLMAKLQSAGCPFTEQMIALFVIEGLTSEYRPIHTAINALMSQEFLTLRWLTQALLQEEAMIKSYKSQSRGEPTMALYVDQATMSATRRKEGRAPAGSGKKPSSTSGTGPSMGGSKGQPRPNCSHCFKPGHTIDRCWALHGKPVEHGTNKPKAEKATVAHVETASVAVELGCTVGIKDIAPDEWLWDSGASASMTPDAGLLHNLWPLDHPTQVRLGDGRSIPIAAIGDLHSSININSQKLELFFPDVLHVPELGQNLLSSFVILNNGYQMRGNRNSFLVKQELSGAPLLIGQTRNKLSCVPLVVVRAGHDRDTALPSIDPLAKGSADAAMTLEVVPCAGGGQAVSVAAVGSANATMTLEVVPDAARAADVVLINAPAPVTLTLDQAHQRFGHISQARLVHMLMASSGVTLNQMKPLSPCAVCQLSKSTRLAVGKGPASWANGKGGLFHADIVSIPTTSLGGKTAFIMFINDHMRYRFHLPICTKDECSTKLGEVLKTLPEGVHVHMLQSDCGSEFTGAPFLKVLQEHGI